MIDPRVLLATFLLSAVFAYGLYFTSRQAKSYIPKDNRPLFLARYDLRSLIAPAIIFVNMLFIQLYVTGEVFSSVLGLMLTLTVVFGILLLLLPVLRKILSAESCASLWVIPCLLLCTYGWFPSWCIPLPFAPPSAQTIRMLFWIWFAGFAAVMLWSVLTHLLFRQRLLKSAKPAENDTYQQVWLKQLKIMNLPAGKIRLCVTNDTQTPLSIGLFWRTTCLVLPEQDYSPEELEMILKHELIHISRRDSLLKFTMSLWMAFMWFNPLAWIALRVCAQDLELSCDEAVVYGRSKQSRKEYARLLLHSAPRQLGYTTCLSAAASSLRYRLKNILTDRKRITGSIIVGILCFLILLGGMCAGIRYQAVPANELLFTETDINQLKVGEMMYEIGGAGISGGECKEDQRLLEYLCGLPLQKTTEKPDVYSASSQVQITIHAPDHNYRLTFGDEYLQVLTVTFSETDDDSRWKTTYYQMVSEPDWQFLLSCIENS
jgi:beta-lactamase regulating signal transducer with metallopeptidase domain